MTSGSTEEPSDEPLRPASTTSCTGAPSGAACVMSCATAGLAPDATSTDGAPSSDTTKAP